MTQRLVGHYTADAQLYRPRGEVEEAKKVEPIVRLRKRLQEEAGVEAGKLDQISDEVRSEIDAAADRALQAPSADASRAREHLYG
jgi:TPP-dependent pyruvate/acetoin dehydrogenase alpha subunit